eukprot:545365_1
MFAVTILLGVFFTITVISEWIQTSSPKLPRADYCIAVGFYNGSIYLLGGYGHRYQITEYAIERNLFIDHGLEAMHTYAPFQLYGVYGYAQFWTQIDHLLYVEESYGKTEPDKISIFNMETKTFASSVIGGIPTDGGINSCMTSNTTHLFLLGGDYGFAVSIPLALVRLYDISSNQWITAPSVPSMNSNRLGFACIIHPTDSKLYAIGGVASSDTASSSIETVQSNDITHSTWEYISGTLSRPLAWCICEIYKNNIYVVGGASATYVVTKNVHVINILTSEVSLLSDPMPIEFTNVAPLVVDHSLYVFGGWNSNANDGVSTWMMYDLYIPTIETTEPFTFVPTNMTFTATDSITYIPTTSTTHDITEDRTTSTTAFEATEQISSDPTEEPSSNPITSTPNPTTAQPTVLPTISRLSPTVQRTTSPLSTKLPTHTPSTNIPTDMPSATTPTLWVPVYRRTTQSISYNTYGSESTVTSTEHTPESSASDKDDTSIIYAFVISGVVMIIAATLMCGVTCKMKRGERNLSVSESALRMNALHNENMKHAIRTVEGVADVEEHNRMNRRGENVEDGVQTATTIGCQLETKASERANQGAYEVQYWLQYVVGLPQYFETFMDSGYEAMGFIKAISTMVEVCEIGIESKQHQMRILQEIKKLKAKGTETQTTQTLQKGENRRGEGSIGNNNADKYKPQQDGARLARMVPPPPPPPRIIYGMNIDGNQFNQTTETGDGCDTANIGDDEFVI